MEKGFGLDESEPGRAEELKWTKFWVLSSSLPLFEKIQNYSKMVFKCGFDFFFFFF